MASAAIKIVSKNAGGIFLPFRLFTILPAFAVLFNSDGRPAFREAHFDILRVLSQSKKLLAVAFHPCLCFYWIWRILEQLLLHLGYGVQKMSFQGVRVVSHRRDLLEIPLKAKPPIFFQIVKCFLIFCNHNKQYLSLCLHCEELG